MYIMSDINTIVAVAVPVLLVVIIVSLITKPSDNYHPRKRDPHKGESSYYPNIHPMKEPYTPSKNIHPTYPYPTHHKHPQFDYDPNRHYHDHHHFDPNDHHTHNPGKPPQPNLGPGGTQHLLGPGGTQEQQ